MTVVVMNNMTTIGLTLYISALPVDRIKALKEAAGSFSFFVISFAYKKHYAMSSIMSSCTVSVVRKCVMYL